MYILFGICWRRGCLSLTVPVWKRVAYAAGLVGGVIGLMANTQRATMLLLVITVPIMAVLARQRQAFGRIAAGLALFNCAAGRKSIRRTSVPGANRVNRG